MPNIAPVVSFRNKVREALYKRKLLLKRNVHDQIFSLDQKTIAYPFVNKFGVKTPELYFENMRLDDLDFNGISSSFVLKPEQSHSSNGVFLNCITSDSDFYHELIMNKDIKKSEILLLAQEEMLEKKIPNKWMVEELLMPDDGGYYAIDDWKFYTFYGEIGLILQKHKRLDGIVQYKLYDKDLNVVNNTGKYIGKINNDLPVAKHIEEMVDVAKKLSASIPRAYMRVDLFSTTKGVVFGEFTPFPGGFSMFWKTWDQTLGQLWLEAEARLECDIRTGKFSELYNSI